MKRHIFIIGSSYFISLITACSLGLMASNIIFSVLCLLTVVILLFKKLRANTVILTAIATSILAFAAFIAYTYTQVLPVQKLDGMDAQISATLCDLPQENNGKYSYVLETSSIELEGAKQNIKLKINTNNPIDIDIYDNIRAKVHFYMTNDDTGSFNNVSYHNSKGFYISAYMYTYEDYEVTKATSYPPYYYALRLRQKISDSINSTMPARESALVNAVMLGNKQALDENISENLKISGVSHLMSVSGLHMAIVGQFIMAFFLFLNFPKRLSAFFTVMFVAAFMALTGFVPSVIRAGIMCIIFYLGIVFRKQADSLNSLGIAVLLICLFNPLAGGDLGLILSYFATLALIVFSPRLKCILQLKTKNIRKNKFCDKLISSINATVATTVSAAVFTLPFTIAAFSEISLISILGNVLMVYPASLMMLLAMLCSLVNLLEIFALILPITACVYLLSKYIISVSALIAQIPFAHINTSNDFILLWLCFTILLVAFLFLCKNHVYFRRIVCLYCSLILLCGIASYQIFNHPYAEVSVFSCGNNTAVTASNNGYHCVLSCGNTSSSSKNIVSKLQAQYINKLTAVIVPDSKDTSSASAGSIIQEFNPSYMLMHESTKETESIMTALSSGNNNTQNIHYFTEQANLKVTDSIDTQVQSDEKNKSFIISNINGFKIIICPSGGDIENIPEDERYCDFFIMSKVPKNVEKLDATYTILSMYEDEAIKTIKYAKFPKSQHILKTSDGDIKLKLKQDKSAKISVDI